jgi:hypothetical protein
VAEPSVDLGQPPRFPNGNLLDTFALLSRATSGAENPRWPPVRPRPMDGTVPWPRWCSVSPTPRAVGPLQSVERWDRP